MFGVTFLPVLWSPAGAPIAGVPGPRRSADECDAGWFAPVATRRRFMFGGLRPPSRWLAVLPGGRPPGAPRHAARLRSTSRKLALWRTPTTEVSTAAASMKDLHGWRLAVAIAAVSRHPCRASVANVVFVRLVYCERRTAGWRADRNARVRPLSGSPVRPERGPAAAGKAAANRDDPVPILIRFC
jgi:hypothetical protein